MTVSELRKKLGLKDGQLLTCASGFHGDLLAIRGNTAVLGVLETGKTIEVPIPNILSKPPCKSES